MADSRFDPLLSGPIMLKAVSPSSSGRNPHGDGRYIPILDGWRAVAIMLVLLCHGLYNADLGANTRLAAFSVFAGRVGALGVLIFFCISGYLITQRLLVESRATNKLSLKTFYIKRAFRILPPLVAYLLVLVALYLAGVIVLQKRDLSALVFLTNYYKGSWYTGHFWSLSIEEHFYLFWPVYAVLVGWRRAMKGGIAIILAVAIWRPFEMAYVVSHHVGTLAGYLEHTDTRIDYIMMGAVVALAVEFYPWFTPVLRRLGSTPGLALLLILLIASTRSGHIDLRTIQALVLTLMVAGSAIADAPLPRLLLANRPMLFLGKVSYSLYVWQQLFFARTHSSFWNSPTTVPLKLAAALLTAYISYRFIEKPFIRYGRSLITPKPRSSTDMRMESVA